MEYEKMLTKEALKSIQNNEIVTHPVMQVIHIEKTPSLNDNYGLIISDGENTQYVWMTIILNSMVSAGKLTKFSLVKINNYMTSDVFEPSKQRPKYIIISDLEVIVPGSIIHKTIGNPRRLRNMEASASTAQVNENCSGLNRTDELNWRSLMERGLHSRLLTKGALQSMLCNVRVKSPIMQVLTIKQLFDATTGHNSYRLIISDGQHHYSSVNLTNSLNFMITCSLFKEYSVIQITNYAVVKIINGSCQNEPLIILKNLVCLFHCPGRTIGDPQPANAGQVVVNSNPVSTDGSDSIDHEMDNLLQNLDTLHMF